MKKIIKIILIILCIYPLKIFALNSGFQTIGKDRYYFDADGNMQYGIQTINGQKYLFGITSGKLYTSGLVEITYGEQQGIYYTNSEGIVQTGFQTIGKDKYYFNEEGKLQKGIVEVAGKKYLLGITSGKLYTSGVAEITYGEQQGIYYTNSEGIVQTGFQTIGKDKYYFNEEGKLQKGIVEVAGKKYLLGITSGKLYTSGVAEITYGEQQGIYYTNSEGIVQTGFQTIGKDKYYFNEEGKLQKGIVEVAGKKYLLGITSGKLYTAGLAEITYGEQQGVYYTNSEGQVEIGFKVVGKNKYYFDDETGKMVKNTIRTIENDKYYFDANGAMQYGIQTINGQKYLFGITSGKLYTSGLAEITYGDQKGIYYTNSDGILLNGIQTINGQKYLFGINSYKLYFGWAQTPNGNIYYSDPTTGIIYTGRLEIDNNWYNFDDNGVLQTGWQTIDNKEYYFYADGTKARGMSKISGSRHLFSDTGECLKKNVKLWIDVSYAQGDIEWDSLWKSGDIDGVILRIGRGAYIEDAKFKRNIAAVKRLGIPYSIYYFSYAENTAEALQEARNMVHIYKKYGVSTSIPTYYDIEYYTHMTSEQYKNIVETYSKFARQNGIDVKVYASARFAEKKLLNYTEWVAHYTGTKISDNPNENIYDIYPKRVTDYKGNWKIWQYSNNGHVTGIKGRVDFNVYVR